jgi:pimeloyl-ACP methyl ester carboxylesterase
MAYHPSREVSDFHVEAYARPLQTSAGRRALSRSAASLRSPDLASASRHYHEIDVPTLLLWGAADPVVPLWVGERLASVLPQARLEIMARCGHMPQEEDPEASLDHLLRFMEDRGWSGLP